MQSFPGWARRLAGSDQARSSVTRLVSQTCCKQSPCDASTSSVWREFSTLLARPNLPLAHHTRHEVQQLISLRECLGKVLDSTAGLLMQAMCRSLLILFALKRPTMTQVHFSCRSFIAYKPQRAVDHSSMAVFAQLLLPHSRCSGTRRTLACNGCARKPPWLHRVLASCMQPNIRARCSASPRPDHPCCCSGLVSLAAKRASSLENTSWAWPD